MPAVTKEFDALATTSISFENATSFGAAYGCSQAFSRVCVLNFASAQHPGGGFRTGAVAQEETLCRASGLFPTLTRNMAMYGYAPKGIYTDRMIYSPGVPVFRDDAGALLPEPFVCDIVSAAACNQSALNKRDMTYLDEIMLRRTRKVLMQAKAHRVDCIVLGAWGTGVFRNGIEEVAQWFEEALRSIHFEGVVFAIPDARKLAAFEDAFLASRASSEEAARVAAEAFDATSSCPEIRGKGIELVKAGEATAPSFCSTGETARSPDVAMPSNQEHGVPSRREVIAKRTAAEKRCEMIINAVRAEPNDPDQEVDSQHEVSSRTEVIAERTAAKMRCRETSKAVADELHEPGDPDKDIDCQHEVPSSREVIAERTAAEKQCKRTSRAEADEPAERSAAQMGCRQVSPDEPDELDRPALGGMHASHVQG